MSVGRQFWSTRNCRELAKELEYQVNGIICVMEGYDTVNSSSPEFDMDKPCLFIVLEPGTDRELAVKEVKDIIVTSPRGTGLDSLPIKSITF